MRYFYFALITLCLFGCQHNSNGTFNQQNIDSAINKALNFLAENQLETGEFRSQACYDESMQNCFYDSSPFVTSFVLYSVANLANSESKKIIKKGIHFLLNEQQPGGIWSYWSSSNTKKIQPDLDDTATISLILKKNNASFEDNRKLILENIDQNGRFLTWINTPDNENDIDCVVNANVLFYLGKNIIPACQYLNQAIYNKKSCSHYYVNEISQYYSYSRAFTNGVSCLEKSKNAIIKSILSKRKDDNSFGSAFYTALSINTLINYGYDGFEIYQAVNHLLSQQHKNGSWQSDIFYKGPRFCEKCLYWHSTELSTAIAIEALLNFKATSPAKSPML